MTCEHQKKNDLIDLQFTLNMNLSLHQKMKNTNNHSTKEISRLSIM